MLISWCESETRVQFIPSVELISMFIHLETKVKLSGGNWQQLGKISRGLKAMKSSAMKVGSHTPLIQLPNKLSLLVCVSVGACFDSATIHKADICIMTAVAPALSTALVLLKKTNR